MKNSYKIILAVIAGLLIFAGTVWRNVKDFPFVDPNLYQAVFLDGNQHYFGHLHNLGTKYPYLTDVYYVKPQAANADNVGNQFALVKMGSEVHGPYDVLYFNWERMLFWQNLKADSKVVKGIAEEKLQRAGQATILAPATVLPTVE